MKACHLGWALPRLDVSAVGLELPLMINGFKFI